MNIGLSRLFAKQICPKNAVKVQFFQFPRFTFNCSFVYWIITIGFDPIEEVSITSGASNFMNKSYTTINLYRSQRVTYSFNDNDIRRIEDSCFIGPYFETEWESDLYGRLNCGDSSQMIHVIKLSDGTLLHDNKEIVINKLSQSDLLEAKKHYISDAKHKLNKYERWALGL